MTRGSLAKPPSSLAGWIPDTLGQLTSLKELNLSKNLFRGEDTSAWRHLLRETLAEEAQLASRVSKETRGHGRGYPWMG